MTEFIDGLTTADGTGKSIAKQQMEAAAITAAGATTHKIGVNLRQLHDELQSPVLTPKRRTKIVKEF